MAEKAGGSASLLNNLWTLWTLWTNVPSVYFFRKVSIFSKKVAKKKQCEVEAVRMPYRGHRQRSSWARQPMRPIERRYYLLPTNNTRIAADCCDITISKSHWEYSEAAKQRSGIQVANAAAGSAACCLSGARAPAYCLLAADIICRNLKDLLLRLLS